MEVAPGIRDHSRAETPEHRAPASPSLDILILYAQPVFWSMGEGRGAIIFSRLPEALARRGHRVRISLPGRPGDPEGEVVRGVELCRTPARSGFVPDPECPLPERLARRLSCWLRYQSFGVKAGRRLAAERRPDVVIGMGYYEAPAARKLARSLGVPNVTRLFGNTLSLQLGRGLRFYANFPEIIALWTPADLVILNDDGADGERVAKKLRVRRENFRHLRNGVDFRLFHPGPPGKDIRALLGIPPGAPLLLTATRLAQEKKLERAIEGLHGLLAFRPDARHVLLGAGPEEDRLRARARDLGVSSRVLLPGAIVQSELPDWFRSADVVLSLLDRTNGANPVFEAMACGRTVVVLDAGTTREIVDDGRTGVVLAREDLPRLGEILGRLLSDRGRMEELGRAAAEAIPGKVMDLEERLDLEVDLITRAARGQERPARGQDKAGPGQEKAGRTEKRTVRRGNG